MEAFKYPILNGIKLKLLKEAKYFGIYLNWKIEISKKE